MRIYLATWLLEKSQGQALTRAGAKNRLISYFHTKDKSDEEVEQYIEKGT